MWRALLALLWMVPGLCAHGSVARAQGMMPALMNGYSSIGPNTSFPAPSLMPSFTGTNNNPSLTAFLATGCGPGIRIVSGGSQNTQDKPNIAKQCELGDTLGDYIPMCAMNTDPGQCGSAGTKYMGNTIDGFAVGQSSNGFSHSTWLYVNEPAYNNVDYGQVVSGYTAGTTLTVVSGTFTDTIGENAILCYGLNNCTGNYVTGVLSGSGQVGTYSLATSQTIGSAGSPVNFLILDESSIPFNASAMQIIYQYAHGKYPWIKVGYSPDQSKSPDAALELYRHGAMADFGQDEDYEDAYQTGGNPWQATHALYPALIRVGLVEGTTTYCARAGVLAGVHGRYQLHQDYLDVLGVWSVDNLSDYHLWGYPIADPMIAQMMLDHAQAGSNVDCNQTFSIDITGNTVQGQTPLYPGSTLSGHGVVRNINDVPSVTSYNTSTYTRSTCDYRTFSGLNVNLGIVEFGGSTYTASGVTQTNPSAPAWDTRPCGSATFGDYTTGPTFTITVGAGQMCQDEVTSPITGYSAGTTLTVTGGTFNKNLTYYVGITGGGFATGTYITGASSSFPTGGTTGTYTITPSQTVGSSGSPVSMNAQWGLSTCAVEFRTHNNSSAGTGVTTYDVLNVFF